MDPKGKGHLAAFNDGFSIVSGIGCIFFFAYVVVTKYLDRKTKEKGDMQQVSLERSVSSTQILCTEFKSKMVDAEPSIPEELIVHAIQEGPTTASGRKPELPPARVLSPRSQFSDRQDSGSFQKSGLRRRVSSTKRESRMDRGQVHGANDLKLPPSPAVAKFSSAPAISETSQDKSNGATAQKPDLQTLLPAAVGLQACYRGARTRSSVKTLQKLKESLSAIHQNATDSGFVEDYDDQALFHDFWNKYKEAQQETAALYHLLESSESIKTIDNKVQQIKRQLLEIDKLMKAAFVNKLQLDRERRHYDSLLKPIAELLSELNGRATANKLELPEQTSAAVAIVKARDSIQGDQVSKSAPLIDEAVQEVQKFEHALRLRLEQRSNLEKSQAEAKEIIEAVTSKLDKIRAELSEMGVPAPENITEALSKLEESLVACKELTAEAHNGCEMEQTAHSLLGSANQLSGRVKLLRMEADHRQNERKGYAARADFLQGRLAQARTKAEGLDLHSSELSAVNVALKAADVAFTPLKALLEKCVALESMAEDTAAEAHAVENYERLVWAAERLVDEKQSLVGLEVSKAHHALEAAKDFLAEKASDASANPEVMTQMKDAIGSLEELLSMGVPSAEAVSKAVASLKSKVTETTEKIEQAHRAQEETKRRRVEAQQKVNALKGKLKSIKRNARKFDLDHNKEVSGIVKHARLLASALEELLSDDNAVHYEEKLVACEEAVQKAEDEVMKIVSDVQRKKLSLDATIAAARSLHKSSKDQAKSMEKDYGLLSGVVSDETSDTMRLMQAAFSDLKVAIQVSEDEENIQKCCDSLKISVQDCKKSLEDANHLWEQLLVQRKACADQKALLADATAQAGAAGIHKDQEVSTALLTADAAFSSLENHLYRDVQLSKEALEKGKELLQTSKDSLKAAEEMVLTASARAQQAEAALAYEVENASQLVTTASEQLLKLTNDAKEMFEDDRPPEVVAALSTLKKRLESAKLGLSLAKTAEAVTRLSKGLAEALKKAEEAISEGQHQKAMHVVQRGVQRQKTSALKEKLRKIREEAEAGGVGRARAVVTALVAATSAKVRLETALQAKVTVLQRWTIVSDALERFQQTVLAAEDRVQAEQRHLQEEIEIEKERLKLVVSKYEAVKTKLEGAGFIFKESIIAGARETADAIEFATLALGRLQVAEAQQFISETSKKVSRLEMKLLEEIDQRKLFEATVKNAQALHATAKETLRRLKTAQEQLPASRSFSTSCRLATEALEESERRIHKSGSAKEEIEASLKKLEATLLDAEGKLTSTKAEHLERLETRRKNEKLLSTLRERVVALGATVEEFGLKDDPEVACFVPGARDSLSAAEACVTAELTFEGANAESKSLETLLQYMEKAEKAVVNGAEKARKKREDYTAQVENLQRLLDLMPSKLEELDKQIKDLVAKQAILPAFISQNLQELKADVADEQSPSTKNQSIEQAKQVNQDLMKKLSKLQKEVREAGVVFDELANAIQPLKEDLKDNARPRLDELEELVATYCLSADAEVGQAVGLASKSLVRAFQALRCEVARKDEVLKEAERCSTRCFEALDSAEKVVENRLEFFEEMLSKSSELLSRATETANLLAKQIEVFGNVPDTILKAQLQLDDEISKLQSLLNHSKDAKELKDSSNKLKKYLTTAKHAVSEGQLVYDALSQQRQDQLSRVASLSEQLNEIKSSSNTDGIQDTDEVIGVITEAEGCISTAKEELSSMEIDVSEGHKNAQFLEEALVECEKCVSSATTKVMVFRLNEKQRIDDLKQELAKSDQAASEFTLKMKRLEARHAESDAVFPPEIQGSLDTAKMSLDVFSTKFTEFKTAKELREEIQKVRKDVNLAEQVVEGALQSLHQLVKQRTAYTQMASLLEERLKVVEASASQHSVAEKGKFQEALKGARRTLSECHELLNAPPDLTQELDHGLVGRAKAAVANVEHAEMQAVSEARRRQAISDLQTKLDPYLKTLITLGDKKKEGKLMDKGKVEAAHNMAAGAVKNATEELTASNESNAAVLVEAAIRAVVEAEACINEEAKKYDTFNLELSNANQVLEAMAEKVLVLKQGVDPGGAANQSIQQLETSLLEQREHLSKIQSISKLHETVSALETALRASELAVEEESANMVALRHRSDVVSSHAELLRDELSKAWTDVLAEDMYLQEADQCDKTSITQALAALDRVAEIQGPELVFSTGESKLFEEEKAVDEAGKLVKIAILEANRIAVVREHSKAAMKIAEQSALERVKEILARSEAIDAQARTDIGSDLPMDLRNAIDSLQEILSGVEQSIKESSVPDEVKGFISATQNALHVAEHALADASLLKDRRQSQRKVHMQRLTLLQKRFSDVDQVAHQNEFSQLQEVSDAMTAARTKLSDTEHLLAAEIQLQEHNQESREKEMLKISEDLVGKAEDLVGEKEGALRMERAAAQERLEDILAQTSAITCAAKQLGDIPLDLLKILSELDEATLKFQTFISNSKSPEELKKAAMDTVQSLLVAKQALQEAQMKHDNLVAEKRQMEEKCAHLMQRLQTLRNLLKDHGLKITKPTALEMSKAKSSIESLSASLPSRFSLVKNDFEAANETVWRCEEMVNSSEKTIWDLVHQKKQAEAALEAEKAESSLFLEHVQNKAAEFIAKTEPIYSKCPPSTQELLQELVDNISLLENLISNSLSFDDVAAARLRLKNNISLVETEIERVLSCFDKLHKRHSALLNQSSQLNDRVDQVQKLAELHEIVNLVEFQDNFCKVQSDLISSRSGLENADLSFDQNLDSEEESVKECEAAICELEKNEAALYAESCRARMEPNKHCIMM